MPMVRHAFATLLDKRMVEPISQPHSSHTDQGQNAITSLIGLSHPLQQIGLIDSKLKCGDICLLLTRIQVNVRLVSFLGEESGRTWGGGDPGVLLETESLSDFEVGRGAEFCLQTGEDSLLLCVGKPLVVGQVRREVAALGEPLPTRALLILGLAVDEDEAGFAFAVRVRRAIHAT